MTINQAHNWDYYTDKIATWRGQAVTDYNSSIYAVTHATMWRTVKNITPHGVNIALHVGIDEKHPKDKTNGVTKAINDIYKFDSNIAIPALDIYILKQIMGKIPNSNKTRQIYTVGMHVDENSTDKATIFLTGSSVLSNPMVGKALSGVSALKRKGKNYYAAGGKRGVRGVADYMEDSVSLHKRSTRVAAVVVHEIGHILHQTQNPNRFWPLNCCGGDFKQVPRIAENVSAYAGNNFCEYVAEVFTAKVYGFTLSTAINNDYTALGGPA